MNREALKNVTNRLVSLCREAEKSGRPVVITGHDMPDPDSIISCVMLQELLRRAGAFAPVKFATRPDGVTERLVRELGVLDRVDFGGFEESERLVLVDHHASFYKNEVIACVDHHTTPPEPDFALNFILKASSCGKIIFDMAKAVSCSDDWMERLAIYSVYLDTQSTLAPKFDKNDLPWLKDGISRLGLDERELIQKGYCLNSPDESAKTLAMYAFKRYDLGSGAGASTCIQIDPDESGWEDKIGAAVDYLKKKAETDGVSLWVFVVNKPTVVRSELYFIRSDGIELKKLDRLASRSRDVVPFMAEI